jgi:hypothetical protein
MVTAERHMDGLRAVGREHRVFGRRRLHAHLAAAEVFDRGHGALAVEVAQAERGERQHMAVLDGRVEHFAHGGDQPGIGDRLDQLRLGAEDVVDRQHAGFRRDGGRVRGGRDHEVDVAGADLLQHLRLLPQLRARELIDQHRALAEFRQLGVEQVRGDAVARRMRLVIGEAVVMDVRGLRDDAAEQADRRGQRRAYAPWAHLTFLPLRRAFCDRCIFGRA